MDKETDKAVVWRINMKREVAIQIYDKNNIDDLKWSQHPGAETARKYLVPLIKNGSRRYIDNVDTAMLALKVDDLILPVSIGKLGYNNSFVCSPYGHYISSAIDEISRLKRPALKLFLQPFLVALGFLFKRLHFDQVAIINNWLFTTNLYPALNRRQVEAITDFMIAQYPQHAILFRCINQSLTGNLKAILSDQGYQMIPSRPIFVVNIRDAAHLKRKNVRQDMKILQSSGHEELGNKDITTADIRQMVQRYKELYLGKYSLYNPQYNERFFALSLSAGIYSFRVLRKKNRVGGYVSFFSKNNVLLGVMMGYDVNAPQSMGLYRMLMAICLREAGKLQMPLHWSSGTAEFKCLRGAVPDLEYQAVYNQHLPLYRRLPWKILAFLIHTFGKRLVKNLKLLKAAKKPGPKY